MLWSQFYLYVLAKPPPLTVDGDRPLAGALAKANDRRCLLCEREQPGLLLPARQPPWALAASKQLAQGRTAHELVEDLVGRSLRPEAHSSALCPPCLRLLQEVDWLRAEAARLGHQVCATFETSKSDRERQFLAGQQPSLADNWSDTVFCHVKDVLLLEDDQLADSPAFKLETAAVAAAAKPCPEPSSGGSHVVTELRNCTLRLQQDQLSHLG